MSATLCHRSNDNNNWWAGSFSAGGGISDFLAYNIGGTLYSGYFSGAPLYVTDTIETTGGVQFADGSIQTTAATPGALSGDFVQKTGDTMSGSLEMTYGNYDAKLGYSDGAQWPNTASVYGYQNSATGELGWYRTSPLGGDSAGGNFTNSTLGNLSAQLAYYSSEHGFVNTSAGYFSNGSSNAFLASYNSSGYTGITTYYSGYFTGNPLYVGSMIETNTGIQFPDGSVQTTAATPGALSGDFVQKAGDTMTGNLTLEGSSSLTMYNGSIIMGPIGGIVPVGSGSLVSLSFPDYAVATGNHSIAFGNNATNNGWSSAGDNSIAVGYMNTANGAQSVALGTQSAATGLSSVAIGEGVSSGGESSVALGSNIGVSGDHAVGIGLSTNAYAVTQPNTMAIMGGKLGVGTPAPEVDLTVVGSVEIGDSNNHSYGQQSISMGSNNISNGQWCISLGYGNIAGLSSSDQYCTAIGGFNTTGGTGGSVALGNYAHAFNGGVAIGHGVSAEVGGAVAIGGSESIMGGSRNTDAKGADAVAIGQSSLALGDNSIAIGRRAISANQGAIVFADSLDADFTSTANDQFLVRAAGGVGVNTIEPTAALDVNGNVAIRKGSDFSAGNGSNNDINVGNFSFIRITGPSGVFTITGISGGSDGKVIILYNTTGQNMTIAHDSASSQPANRIYTMTGANVTSTGQATAMFVYDTTASRWIMVSWNP